VVAHHVNHHITIAVAVVVAAVVMVVIEKAGVVAKVYVPVENHHEPHAGRQVVMMFAVHD